MTNKNFITMISIPVTVIVTILFFFFSVFMTGYLYIRFRLQKKSHNESVGTIREFHSSNLEKVREFLRIMWFIITSIPFIFYVLRYTIRADKKQADGE